MADITILIPAIFLMGSQLQYMGRLLGVADVPKILAAADGGEHYQRRHRHAGHARDCIIEGKE